MSPSPAVCFARSHTSKPLSFGIITSRNTRFGLAERIVSSASSPLDAVSSCTPSSSRSSSVCWISIRRWASSSTIRIFTTSPSLVHDEHDVLEPLLESERLHGIVLLREQRVEDDDVRLHGHGLLHQVRPVCLGDLIPARRQHVGQRLQG